ncbi:MAG: hypothetical protein AB7F09_26505 [Parvibaculaceae bacterium]
MNPAPLYLTLMLVLALGHLAFVQVERLLVLVIGHADPGAGAARVAGLDKKGGLVGLADAASEMADRRVIRGRSRRLYASPRLRRQRHGREASVT